jgi:hypothetical protein
MMKMLVLASALALTGVGTANAADMSGADVPLCSKTVTDSCMNPSQAPHARTHVRHTVHRPKAAAHHAAPAAAARR